MTELPSRFSEKIRVDPGGCWLWTAAQDQKGYPLFAWHRVLVKAHRFAYERMVGPIPKGLTLDHLCRVRNCVNPEHLEPVTNRVNVLRGRGVTAVNAIKTHCLRGHPLSGYNLYTPPGTNWRACRTCMVNQTREFRRKHRLLEAKP